MIVPKNNGSIGCIEITKENLETFLAMMTLSAHCEEPSGEASPASFASGFSFFLG